MPGPQIIEQDFSGYEVDQTYGDQTQYATMIDAYSAFNFQFKPDGTIMAGYLDTEGQVEGYDSTNVLAGVNFSMTLGEKATPPEGQSPAAIPFTVTANMEAYSQAQTYNGYTDTAFASASLDVDDLENPSSQSSGHSGVSATGTQDNVASPSLKIETFPGDTMVIGLSTFINIGGADLAAYDKGSNSWYSSGLMGAFAMAVVDPVFAFDQQAFDEEMGPNTYNLSDYYTFNFSPNMTSVPEPSTMLLLGTGLLCLAGLGRKKFKKI